jgi:import inner membrane translocase subunit TIM21
MPSTATPAAVLRLCSRVRQRPSLRFYATQTGLGTSNAQPSRPRRKQVTTFNDDGRVPWGDLSGREKAARTTQQTFNFGMVIVGTVLTAGVAYFLYTEVFSLDSKTAHFNRAVNRVKADPRCAELLGDSKKITAYGEPTWNKWARARPIAHTFRKDGTGAEHLIMHFNVEGPLSKGVVNLHMVKRPSESEYDYKYLFLDVPGHQRLYLENADASSNSLAKGKTKLFGVQWTR